MKKEYTNDKGELHRTDGPAIEYPSGTKEWYLNGQLHRTDGPAVERANGTKEWYLNDQLHRVNGPAIERADGSKHWCLNGQRHRVDGPAVEWLTGIKDWWVDGERVDSYFPDPCFKPKTRQEALDRLNSKVRPYSYNLYLKDINERFPE